MKSILTILCLPLLGLCQDPTGIYSPSVREGMIKGTDKQLTDLERAGEKANELGVPLFAWVNMNPKDYPDLYDSLRGVHIQLPTLFNDSSSRVGSGVNGNFLFIRASKLGPNSAQRLLDSLNETPVPVERARQVMPTPTQTPPQTIAYTAPSGGGAGKAFRSGNYNPTHTCPNCGSPQYVIAGWNADGTHTHTCNVCGTSWRH